MGLATSRPCRGLDCGLHKQSSSWEQAQGRHSRGLLAWRAERQVWQARSNRRIVGSVGCQIEGPRSQGARVSAPRRRSAALGAGPAEAQRHRGSAGLRRARSSCARTVPELRAGGDCARWELRGRDERAEATPRPRGSYFGRSGQLRNRRRRPSMHPETRLRKCDCSADVLAGRPYARRAVRQHDSQGRELLDCRRPALGGELPHWDAQGVV